MFQALADDLNVPHFHTSAKDAINVEAVFRSLASYILEKRPGLIQSVSSQPIGLGGSKSRFLFDMENNRIIKLTAKKHCKTKVKCC